MQCNYKLLCIGFIFLHIGNNKNKALKKFLKNWKVEYFITNPRTEPDQKLFLHCSWIHMPMNLLQAIFSLVWTGKLNLIYTYHTFVHWVTFSLCVLSLHGTEVDQRMWEIILPFFFQSLGFVHCNKQKMIFSRHNEDEITVLKKGSISLWASYHYLPFLKWCKVCQ